jgi:hypothetical protein
LCCVKCEKPLRKHETSNYGFLTLCDDCYQDKIQEDTETMTDEIPQQHKTEFQTGDEYLEDDSDGISEGDRLAALTTDDASAVLTLSRDTHGDAVENQQHIADAWDWYLGGHGKLADGETIDGTDVAMMMGLLKMSRAAVGEFDVDHLRDVCGYAAIGNACAVDRGDASESDLSEYHDPEEVEYHHRDTDH